MTLRQDAERIMRNALQSAMPDTAVGKALDGMPSCGGKLVLVAIGKAGWQMANAAYERLGSRIDDGIVITKYGHSKGPIGFLRIREAGHPVPDENSYSATEEALGLVKDLKESDTVLFLVSGGGSALFEKPLVSGKELQAITDALLRCGADIREINTVRKRLSAVKGGRFAVACAPAQVYTVILSDVLGDAPDVIASGPAVPDTSTPDAAVKIAKRYRLSLSPEAELLFRREPVTELNNVTTVITGSVRILCESAAKTAEELGYSVTMLTDRLDCEAAEGGRMLAGLAGEHRDTERSLAFIAGGETVVKITGNGLGGRNQELALSAAAGIEGLRDTCVFALGSDGTDGPTDAAGGYADGGTAEILTRQGIEIERVLRDNDSYHALQKCGGLLMTGPTGTNVNDLYVCLIKRSTSGDI